MHQGVPSDIAIALSRSTAAHRTPAQKAKYQRLAATLAELPPKCLRAFILLRYGGMTFESAGRRLGLPPEQVIQLFQRAFERCQKALDEQNGALNDS